MERLLRANLHFLRQAAALLNRLDDIQFSRPMESFHGSSVGGHMRHCIEHYRSFLNGIETGRVDYDDRPREERLEQVVRDARDAVGQLVDEIEKLLCCDLPVGLLVKMDCGDEEIPPFGAS